MNPNTISLVFAGDFCPTGRVKQRYLENNSLCICNDTAEILQNSDFSIVNLECPLTDKLSPIKKLGPALAADPVCAKLVKNMGFDAVSLANNHIMDQGQGGLHSTVEACQTAELKVVGAGKNIEQAEKPLFIELKGYKIAIIACAENEFSIANDEEAGANPLDVIQLYKSINYANENADIVIAIVHGGHEFYELPSQRMVTTYRFLADLGLDAVIGHHTHCVSGYELHNDVPIFYSQGNFLFDGSAHSLESWFKGMLIELIFKNGKIETINLHPFYQCKDEPTVALMDSDSKLEFLHNIDKLGEVIRDKNLLKKRWLEFVESNKYIYPPSLLTMGRLERFLLKRGLYFGKRILPKRLLYLFNYIQCESHRDLSLAHLKNMINKKR